MPKMRQAEPQHGGQSICLRARHASVPPVPSKTVRRHRVARKDTQHVRRQLAAHVSLTPNIGQDKNRMSRRAVDSLSSQTRRCPSHTVCDRPPASRHEKIPPATLPIFGHAPLVARHICPECERPKRCTGTITQRGKTHRWSKGVTVELLSKWCLRQGRVYRERWDGRADQGRR